MREARLVAALAVTIMVLTSSPAQAAKGPANTFDGSCSATGTLTFAEPLGNVPITTEFGDFAAGTCTGTLNGQAVQEAPIEIRGAGSGTLGCLAGHAVGRETLTFTRGTRGRGDDVAVGFQTDTSGVGLEFASHVTGAVSGEGVGEVNFAPYADQAATEACGAGTFSAARYDLVARTIGPMVG